jgi:hypothetical protein
MKTLFTTSMLSLTLLASQAFAGGSGGGAVLMDGKLMASPEIVYFMGQNNGMVSFKYGQLNGKSWTIKDVELSAGELVADQAALRALEFSNLSKQWAEIK